MKIGMRFPLRLAAAGLMLAATLSPIAPQAATPAAQDSAAARATLSGVPSTGQKLNLSANSSWHVSQNFIVTTSLFP